MSAAGVVANMRDRQAVNRSGIGFITWFSVDCSVFGALIVKFVSLILAFSRREKERFGLLPGEKELFDIIPEVEWIT